MHSDNFDRREDEPLDLFEVAVEEGDADGVRRLIENAAPSEADVLALQWASWRGDLTEVQRLMDTGRPLSHDSRALSWAAEQGHTDVVRLLIPESQPKDNGSSALRWAARNGHADIVALLIPVSDPCAVLSEALSAEAANGDAAVVAHLLPVSQHVAESLTCAVAHGHGPTARLILPFCGQPLPIDALRWALRNGDAQLGQDLIPRTPIPELWKRLVGQGEWGSADRLAMWMPLAWARTALSEVSAPLLPGTRARLAAEDLRGALADAPAHPTGTRHRM